MKKFCCCLVVASVSLRWSVGMCSVYLLSALNMSVTFVLALRSSKGVQFNFLRSDVTLTSLLYVLLMNLAALLWTFSSLVMLSSVCGSHTELLYSSMDLTYVM